MRCCHRFVYVLPELLLRPPLGVGILLPTLDPEVPDLAAAGPLPAVDTQSTGDKREPGRKAAVTVQVARGRQTRGGSEHEGLGRSRSPSPQVAGLGWQM